MALTEVKSAQVAGLFAVTPDGVLRRIERALADARRADVSLEPVHALAHAERRAREMIDLVFAPLAPLTEPARPPKQRMLNRAALIDAWRAAVEADPALCARAAEMSAPRGDELPPAEYTAVCLKAADALGARHEVLQRLLRLTPVLRPVRARLPAWVENLNGENVAALRLAFKDALAIDEDAGALFWETVLSYLDQPWRVIRLISAVADRPSDRFVAESELASIGERLLVEIDERLATVKRFDANEGEAAGAAAARAVSTALVIIGEFEEWLTLRKDGPWGARIAAQKQALAQGVEGRLREVEAAVAAALPTLAKGAGKGVRPSPKLVADPQPLLVTRAEAFLTLMEEARGAAAAGGFASLRAKTVEALQTRLEQYCDDLIEVLHRKDAEHPERVRAYLEVATRLVALAQGPQAAQIVRRRAAAA